MADAVIRVEQLSRRFGSFQAVDNLSFDVRRGEVFGFLGANGAGKSTTIRMLCGLLKPTSGRAEVAGLDVGRDPEGVKRHIGYMSQRFSLYELLTVDQNISFYGGLYGLTPDRLATRSSPPWASPTQTASQRSAGRGPRAWSRPPPAPTSGRARSRPCA